ELEELGQIVLGLGRDAAEGVRDEVNTLFERGECLAVFEQAIGDGVGHGPAYHADAIARVRRHAGVASTWIDPLLRTRRRRGGCRRAHRRRRARRRYCARRGWVRWRWARRRRRVGR